MNRDLIVTVILCTAVGCARPLATPSPAPTASPLVTAVASPAGATRAPAPSAAAVPTAMPTAAHSSTPPPSATPRVVAGPVWVPADVDTPIAIHTRAYEYTLSGRPAGMDDASQGCDRFDEGRRVMLLTVTLRIYNRSGREMRDWYAHLFTPAGRPLYTCHQDFERLPVLPHGHYVDVTFGAFTEETGIRVRGYVFDRAVGRSNEVTF